MAKIGPLLTIVSSALDGPARSIAELINDLDSPPFPAHVEVINGEPAVHVMVTTLEGELADLLPEAQAHGFRMRTSTRRVATGWIYVAALDEVAKLSDDLYIEAAGVVHPELDASVPEARNSGAAASVCTGSGVLIGIVDSGLDVGHPSLRDSTGATRVVRYWDQASTSAKPSSMVFGYGSEWTNTDIDAYLATGTPFPSIDRTGHGTQVAGVAGANGLAAPAGRYVGVAEDAEFVVVALQAPAHAFASTANVVEACRYVFDVAAQLKQRAVVNLSSGARLGPHDPRGDFELAISDLLAENTDHIIVTSAGNLGDSSAHARFSIPNGGTHDLVFDVPRFAGSYVAVDIWYALGDRIAVELIDPTGATTRPIEGHHSVRGVLTDWWHIAGVLNVGRVRANQIMVNISGFPDVSAGRWTVRVHGSSVMSGTADAWLDTADGQPTFVGADPDCTVTAPSTADGVLAVTAYCMSPTVGPMAMLSGRGPDRGGQPVNLIAAPGSPITTCLAGNRATSNHGLETGTSLAAAHVSGAVAALLEANPQMDRAAVIACLTGTARTDNDTAVGPASAWGVGKLNIDGAVKCAANQVGGAP